jgi:transposase InsO family protein
VARHHTVEHGEIAVCKGRRGVVRTTINVTCCAYRVVNRHFGADRPNQLWSFTYDVNSRAGNTLTSALADRTGICSLSLLDRIDVISSERRGFVMA